MVQKASVAVMTSLTSFRKWPVIGIDERLWLLIYDGVATITNAHGCSSPLMRIFWQQNIEVEWFTTKLVSMFFNIGTSFFIFKFDLLSININYIYF